MPEIKRISAYVEVDCDNDEGGGNRLKTALERIQEVISRKDKGVEGEE